MAAVVVELCEAIKAAVDAATFTETLSAATVRVDGIDTLESLPDVDASGGVSVTIAPRRIDNIERASRSGRRLVDAVVAIVLRARCDPTSGAQLRRLLIAAEELENKLPTAAEGNRNRYVMTAVERDPLFSEEFLRESNLFASAMEAKYKVLT